MHRSPFCQRHQRPESVKCKARGTDLEDDGNVVADVRVQDWPQDAVLRRLRQRLSKAGVPVRAVQRLCDVASQARAGRIRVDLRKQTHNVRGARQHPFKADDWSCSCGELYADIVSNAGFALSAQSDEATNFNANFSSKWRLGCIDFHCPATLQA